ncbi:MAG: hypothetical protein JKY67_22620 [Pseudomonadales bacterium]|nr:hypothetical protein [Pseudomonadales bacterium]
MNTNILPSSHAPVVGVIDPDNNAAGALSTGWIDMALFHSLMAIILAGTIEATGTIDAKLEQATDSSGTGVKDITGKSITQLTAAGTDSDKQAVINCRSDEIDVNGGFTYVRLTMTGATAAADSAAVVLGFNARYAPAADLSSVDEVVA